MTAAGSLRILAPLFGRTVLGHDMHIRDDQRKGNMSFCGKRLNGLKKFQVLLDVDAEAYAVINGKKIRKTELWVNDGYVCQKCTDALRKRLRETKTAEGA